MTPGASSSQDTFAHAATPEPEAAPSGGASAVPTWRLEPRWDRLEHLLDAIPEEKTLASVHGHSFSSASSKAPKRVSFADDAAGAHRHNSSSSTSSWTSPAPPQRPPTFGAVAGDAAFRAAANAISSASEEEAGDARGDDDDGAHVTHMEGKLLVLLELNSVLIYRDYGGEFTGGETIDMPRGKKIRMFVRPGAEGLVASLLREPRCQFVLVSGMGEKFCLPIAGRFLQRAAPDSEWVLDRHGAAPCWVCIGHPRARVYVLPSGSEQQKAAEKQGDHFVVKDLDQIWAALHECGCGWYTEQNTVMIDTARRASRPESVCVVQRWRPPAEGAEEEDPNPVDPELGRRLLLAFLEEGAGVAQHIGLERATFWGPYHWVTDLEEARYYMKQL